MRIGLLGGTFNPVHNGHVRLAEEARRRLNLDEVLWIPAQVPPHKQMGKRASPEDRVRMVEMAIRGMAGHRLSRADMDRPPPSYSVDTVRLLRKQHPEAGNGWFFLVGSDNGRTLGKWRGIDQLRKWVTFVVLSRPGDPASDQLPSGVIKLPAVTPNLSSSDVRQRIRLGWEIGHLVPKAVAQYIRGKELYQ